MTTIAYPKPSQEPLVDQADLRFDRSDEVLTSEALDFVTRLTRTFRPRIDTLLIARRGKRAAWAAGARLDFGPRRGVDSGRGLAGRPYPRQTSCAASWRLQVRSTAR